MKVRNTGTWIIPAIGLLLAASIATRPAQAQGAGSTTQTPLATAQGAAAKWAGYAASQQLLPAPVTAPTPPASGLTTAGGAMIAPADLGGRMPAGPANGAPATDGILRSAPPTVGVDADGRGAVVSGATIR